MKKYNNIDDLFKEELRDHKVMPEKDLWPEMEKAIFKRKSPKWLFVILTLLLSIPIVYFASQLFGEKESAEISTPDKEIYSKYELNNFTNTVSETEKINDKIFKQTNSINDSYNSVTEEDIAKTVDNNESNNNWINNFEFNRNSKEIIAEYYRQKTIEERKFGYLSLANDHAIDTETNDISIPELYNEKRKLSIYSFISTSAGMTYYSGSPDKFTWSADMGAGYKLGKFYVETGIGFQEMKENGYYRIDYSSEDSVGYYNKVVSFEFGPANPNQIDYNINQTTVYDSVDHYTHVSPTYTYNYINIPLTIGYRFYETEKFKVSIQSGLIFSILNKTISPELEFDDPEAKLIGITNLTPEEASNNVRIQIGIRLNAKLYRGVSLSVQPEFTRWINSVNKNTPDKSLPYTMSVRAGIYYNF